MFGFAVNDNRKVGFAQFLRPIPYFLYKRAGGVIGVQFNSFIVQQVHNLQGGAESRNDHHIVFPDFLPRNKLRAIGVHNKLNTAILQVTVHFLVMDHLTEQVYIFAWILFQRLIADFNGVFHAITKPEVARQIKTHRAKVEQRRRKILLAQIG